jgi:hypothetical protein
MLDNTEEDNDMSWECCKIFDYCKENGDDQNLNHKCLVEWNHIDKTKLWVSYFTLSLNNSKTIISFARNNNLLDKMPFCQSTQSCRSNTAVDIARILTVLTSPAGIKYKFGNQVSKGFNNEIELDKNNGNHLWKEAIKT